MYNFYLKFLLVLSCHRASLYNSQSCVTCVITVACLCVFAAQVWFSGGRNGTAAKLW